MSLTKKPRKIKTAESGNTSVDNGFKKLKLLVTVVNRSKTELFMDFLTAYEVNFQASVLAQGTAHSDMLYMLGLEDSDKSVIFSVVREEKVNDALQMLEEKVNKHNNLIERMFKAEENINLLDEKVKVANHRLDDLEKKG
jgi:hypothetical protein